MKKLIGICLGVIVIVIIAVVIAISMVDVNQYKGDVIQLVQEKTGRQFAVDGEFKLALSLVPTVVVEGVKFGNADWGSRPDMLTVGRLEIQVSLIPLLSNTIKVDRLILIAPEMLLETDKNGKGNWVLDILGRQDKKPAEKVKTGPVALPAFAINEVYIEDAKITYRDGVTEKLSRMNIDKITMEAGGLDEPMNLKLTAAYNDIPVSVEGTLGTVTQFMTNKGYPIKLVTSVNKATLGLDGQISRPKEVAGLDLAISFQVASLAELSQLTGGKLPDFGPINLAGKLTDVEGGYSLKSLSLKAGTTDLAGDMTVLTAGKPPILKAQLESNMIDLAAFAGGEEEHQTEQKKDGVTKVFPSDPLPLDGLKSANIELTLTAKKIQTKKATLENTKLVLTLNSGKLSIKPFNTQLAGGTMESDIVLDGSGKTATLTTNLNIKNLQPGQLSHLKDKITGANTDITIKARGAGNSIAAIMSDLDGHVLLKAGKGQITGKEADPATSSVFLKTYQMLNPGASSQGTQIICSVVNMDIKDGIAPVDKGIALETNHINAIGSGSINFKTEELDIGVIPRAREGAGISVGQLAELVRLSGTFANPTIVPDTRAALKAGLSTGAAVATGGLSLLAQGLYDWTTADEAPCATALGIKTEKASTTNKETTEKSTTEKAVDAVKDSGVMIKDKLKNLFGK